MLCRARSEAETARRLRPPSPTARESSLVSASISSSACSARFDVAPFLGLFQLFAQIGKPPPIGRPWLDRRASRPRPPDRRCGFRPFRDPPLRAASRPQTDRFRHRRAGRRLHRPNQAHGIRPQDDGADERDTRALLSPLNEKISRRRRRSSTHPLCVISLLGRHGLSARRR